MVGPPTLLQQPPPVGAGPLLRTHTGLPIDLITTVSLVCHSFFFSDDIDVMIQTCYIACIVPITLRIRVYALFIVCSVYQNSYPQRNVMLDKGEKKMKSIESVYRTGSR